MVDPAWMRRITYTIALRNLERLSILSGERNIAGVGFALGNVQKMAFLTTQLSRGCIDCV